MRTILLSLFISILKLHLTIIFLSISGRLHTLTALSHYIHCAYSPLSGAAVLMKDVTKVLLGASCLVRYLLTFVCMCLATYIHIISSGLTLINGIVFTYSCLTVPCWRLLVRPWWRHWLKLDRFVV